MSNENTENEGSTEETQVKPTITIAERQSSEQQQATPTITIAERQEDPDPDADQ